MRLLKRTYALPTEIVQPFEEAVDRGHRSALLASLLKNWLEGRRRESLRREVLAGCREMAEEYLAQEQAYHPLEEEVHRGL
jgi:hypothetical protein